MCGGLAGIAYQIMLIGLFSCLGPYLADQGPRCGRCVPLLRQLRHVDRDPPRLVLREQLGGPLVTLVLRIAADEAGAVTADIAHACLCCDAQRFPFDMIG
jgi:hypothetical protein